MVPVQVQPLQPQHPPVRCVECDMVGCVWMGAIEVRGAIGHVHHHMVLLLFYVLLYYFCISICCKRALLVGVVVAWSIHLDLPPMQCFVGPGPSNACSYCSCIATASICWLHCCFRGDTGWRFAFSTEGWDAQTTNGVCFYNNGSNKEQGCFWVLDPRRMSSRFLGKFYCVAL